MPSTYCVVVDTREQRPLPPITHLPLTSRGGTVSTCKIEWVRRPLETGDYALLGHEQGHVFERKAGLAELHQNLLTLDRERFIREMERSRSLKRLTLLVEADPCSMSSAPPHCPGVNPYQVRDALLRLRLAYTHLDFWMVSGKTPNQRRLLAEWMVAALIHSAEGD
jgi:ERCC4-type nuclease